MSRQGYTGAVKLLLTLLAFALIGSAGAQARDFALTPTTTASIDREAQKFTGRSCAGNHKASDMSAAIAAPANSAHLKASYDMMISQFESQLSRFPGSKIKKKFWPGNMGMMWFDLGPQSQQSAFALQALQQYNGQLHLIAYACWLR